MAQVGIPAAAIDPAPAPTYCNLVQARWQATKKSLRDLQQLAQLMLSDAKEALRRQCDRSVGHRSLPAPPIVAGGTPPPGGYTRSLSSSHETYMHAEDVTPVGRPPLLDPAHRFTAQRLVERFEIEETGWRTPERFRRSKPAKLARFALMRRMGAALVRCIERDIKTLNRLQGQLHVTLEDQRSGKWWLTAIGVPLSETPVGTWKVAACWAQQDLEQRGFRVDLLSAKMTSSALQVRWRLAVP